MSMHCRQSQNRMSINRIPHVTISGICGLATPNLVATDGQAFNQRTWHRACLMVECGVRWCGLDDQLHQDPPCLG